MLSLIGTYLVYSAEKKIGGSQGNPMNPSVATRSDQRAVRIFARSIYKELRSNGYSDKEVMELAGELISLLTSDVRVQNSWPASS